MKNKNLKLYNDLDKILRSASVSVIGGFRPPSTKLTSWFGGRGMGLPGETLPQYSEREMFPLLQVRISELPYIPPELEQIEFLIVFFDREEFPFDKPHGEGWLIREYKSIEGLIELPASKLPAIVKDFPIRWSLVTDDTPDCEQIDELIDVSQIDKDDRFFTDYRNYSNTKFGGFPSCIQHGHELEGFVFQIGSEEKAGWMWADCGFAYFNKSSNKVWSWDCQFY